MKYRAKKHLNEIQYEFKVEDDLVNSPYYMMHEKYNSTMLEKKVLIINVKQN